MPIYSAGASTGAGSTSARPAHSPMNSVADAAANARAHLDAEKTARELGGAAKGTQGWWNAKCSAHDDRKASLGLHDTDDGGVAYRCMDGCSNRAVASALKARGLLPERPKSLG